MGYRRRKNRFGVGILTGLVLSAGVFVGGWHLLRTEIEGIMVESPAVVDINSDENDTVYEDTVINMSDLREEDYEVQTAEEQVVVEEAVHSVYDILSQKGYQLSEYPTFQTELLETYDYQAFDYDLGVTTTDVNFRTGPSTEYDIIETLDETTSVDLIAQCENGWYLVHNKGTLGFIRGDYIHQINDEALIEQLDSIPEIVPVVQATSDVNIRPESNTNQPEYGVLKTGKCLEMTRRLENGWYEVLYEGKIAYVCGDFVKESYLIQGDYSKLVAMNKEATVYDVPYGTPMGTIPQFEVARVYGEVDDFYYVESNGQIGYVSKSQCSSLYGTYVIVDISDQMVSLYNGTELLMTSNVVSGSDATPSDIGLFDVDAKQLDATLSGPGYSVGVDYWMPYNGGEGLHDASWRGSFGGDIYHNSGSHGCINMPRDAAQTIYENIHVGDQVLVKR